MHRDVRRPVQRDEREVGQVDLVDLVEDLLPRSGIGRRLLLQEQLIQLVVAVEVNVEASRWKLVATEQRRVIGIIGKRIFELGDIIGARLATGQEGAKERAGRVVLDIQLDADGLEVGLQHQFVIGRVCAPLCR